MTEEDAEEDAEEKEKEKRPDIKSNNPHLTGGEQKKILKIDESVPFEKGAPFLLGNPSRSLFRQMP